MKNSIFVEPPYFIDLFTYDGWANDRILHALTTNASVPDRALELMSHLFRSQAVWYGRIEETEDAHLPTWGRDSLEICTQRREKNAQNWLKLLRASAAGDFNREVTYTNTKGQTYSTELREILTHVVNHGTHHRAQISLLLRSAGFAPPQTDYIAYVRLRD